jgi:ferric-dicitrate binding protein FerR (iron transport regulator)
LTRAAAILLFPLAIAFLLQLQKNGNRPENIQTISTPLASKTTFQLPDGSTVWLNSGSSISFPDEFNGDCRLVKLEGEAFFDVKKGEKPFRVETSHFTVGVLGTAFNVMAYAGEVPAVTLERGKVTLETASKKQAALLPGQQAVVDTVKQSISLNNVEPNLFSSWVRNQLIIKNEPLGTVINKLERWYNIEIDLADQSLRDIQMTANIEFESIREVMELMELTLPVKYEYHKNTRKLVVSKK